MPDAANETATRFLSDVRGRINAYLDGVLPAEDGSPTQIAEALRYSVFAGGKRLRPALAIAAARAVGGEEADVLPFAAALELIHTYSLIHDDLPSMDNDDLRRGRPTSHRAFGEAMAILAGDALHTLAFEIVLRETADPTIARRLGVELATAAGPAGMVGGQAEDMAAVGTGPDEVRLQRIQEGKTAALLRAACRGGGLAGGATDDVADALARYGQHLGIAFQMVDDILDETGTAESIGKTPHKDRDTNHLTWVSVLGIDETRRRADRERERALEALGAVADPSILEALAWFVTQRDR